MTANELELEQSWWSIAIVQLTVHARLSIVGSFEILTHERFSITEMCFKGHSGHQLSHCLYDFLLVSVITMSLSCVTVLYRFRQLVGYWWKIAIFHTPLVLWPLSSVNPLVFQKEKTEVRRLLSAFIMAALCNRGGYYIFAL